jgi:hypothetical protein
MCALHHLGHCMQWTVLFQQSQTQPRPHSRVRLEGSPDFSPEPYLGQGYVCLTYHTPNIPNQMGVRGTTTRLMTDQTTRRSTTLWGPCATSGGRRPRRGQGRLISTRQPVTAKMNWGKSVLATRPRKTATMDKPTQCLSSKNKGAN